ncbi:MAG: glycosyltransferase [Candidatus Dojkabacteria bacterium]|jgi:glycosyltransferase involved in cell wall biosynthesis
MMEKRSSNNLRVAIVTEHLWKMGGANRVLDCFCEIFPQADIYALFGWSSEEEKKEHLSEEICKHNIYYSGLNRWPLVRKYYQYTFANWIKEVEKFDFSKYDLVISSSSSVTHGVITPLDCFHLAYIHSPMRYIWDLNGKYFGEGKSSRFVSFCTKIPFNFARIWDVNASNRADVLIANSKYVKKRIWKYWKRETNVIYPPVKLYDGDIVTKRGEYFVSGAPLEKNKGGDFLLEKAKTLGFNLKVIGTGNMLGSLRRKYGRCKNIEILGWVSEEKKWNLLSNAKGYIVPGLEDYGIFGVEALSCGTPILAFMGGGSLETVTDGVSGMFFGENNFENMFKKFTERKWDYVKVVNSLRNYNTREDFKKKICDVLVDKGIYI